MYDSNIYLMDITGICLNVILFALYCVVTYFIYIEMRQFIILHLDGNRIMWTNFQEITMTRGVLKLDILANIEFFTSFLFILLKDEQNFDPAIWGTMGGLLLFSLIVQYYGGYGIVSVFKQRSFDSVTDPIVSFFVSLPTPTTVSTRRTTPCEASSN